MSDWYASIGRALDRRATACFVFFRDDDAGWDDDRLFALLDCFAGHGVPIDLALIPAALTQALAERLLERLGTGGPGRVGVHQHGYAHVNHEPEGRKCEFGASRGRARQRRDIEAGRAILDGAFGPLADPIFTPPWNRCTPDTAACLRGLGFRALSRDRGAVDFARPFVHEIPVAIDWCRLRRPGDPPHALAEAIAGCFARDDRLGIMLHHAVMDAADLILLDGLLTLLRGHPMVRCVAMRDLLPSPDTHERSGTALDVAKDSG